MNVFVLCTGRCGSTTLIKACSHISNFTAAHESRSSRLGDERLAYADRHIEADNRLSWLLGRLDRAYGDDAYYVHLTRDVRKVAASFVKRYQQGIIKAYRGDGIILGVPEDSDPTRVALDDCDTVDSNIRALLKDKSHRMDFRLEQWQNDFAAFGTWIGADLDLEAAMAEFRIRHNES